MSYQVFVNSGGIYGNLQMICSIYYEVYFSSLLVHHVVLNSVNVVCLLKLAA